MLFLERFFLFIWLFVFLGGENCLGQNPDIFSDTHLPQPEVSILSSSRITATPLTLPFSINEPFFDDFSRSNQFPDTAKWFNDGGKLMPLKYRYGAKENPTEGVLTFDGLNNEGDPYSIVLATGWSDVLESHYIDLSQMQISDNIILSFYLQPQGYGDAPESTDSFYVELRKNDGNWQKVYGVGGSPNTAFQKIMSVIDNPAFFHAEFQIRFRRKGNLNSHIDLWHLDYVFMGANRDFNDLTHNDVALVGLSNPVIAPFTAIPYQQFNGASIMQPFTVTVNNLKGVMSSLSIQATLTDPIGGNVFSGGNQQVITPTINPSEYYTGGYSGFSNQSIVPLNASYLLSVNLPPDADNVVANNRITELCRIDSIFAYDDGESEGSYGITDVRGFGQQYTITSPDYLTAVWISFMPRVHFSAVTQQSTYMDQHPFRLTIWNKAHSDSILYQQSNTVIKYADSVDGFIRYPLYQPIPVSGDIWVGIEQTDSKPVGVGLDMNYDNHTKMYWDSAGYWVQSQIKGTLMIRPELQNVQYHPLTSIPQEYPLTSYHVYPNPATGNTLTVSGLNSSTSWDYTLTDLQGRVLTSGTSIPNSEKIEVSIENISPGYYLLGLKPQNINKSRRFAKVLISSY